MNTFKRVLVLMLSLAITLSFTPSIAFAVSTDTAYQEAELTEPLPEAELSDEMTAEEPGGATEEITIDEEASDEEAPDASQPAAEEEQKEAEEVSEETGDAASADEAEPAPLIEKQEASLDKATEGKSKAPEAAPQDKPAKPKTAPKALTKAEGDTAIAMQLDTEYKASGNDDESSYFTFTPSESGVYRFYSFKKTNGDPYGEIFIGEEEYAYDDDSGGDNNFLIETELEQGTEYTLVAHGYGGGSYNYSVMLVKRVEYTVTFKLTDGYMWDDDGEMTQEKSVQVYNGEPLYDYRWMPEAYINDEEQIYAWALESDPTNVLDRDYIINGNLVLVGVRSKVQDLGAIQLGKAYTASGGVGDYTSFTFTPSESADYRLVINKIEKGNPYVQIYQGEEYLYDGNSTLDIYPEEGLEYTLRVSEQDHDKYSYTIQLIKQSECTVTFTTDGYMYNEDDEEVQQVIWTATAGQTLGDLGWPYVYNDEDKIFKGWALSTEPNVLLKEDYIITDSVTLVCLWGIDQPQGEIELDKDYAVTGEKGDTSVFTFTPQESGYYRFYTVNVTKGDPYAEIKEDGEDYTVDNGNGFYIKVYLEEDTAYTLRMFDYYREEYSFTVKLEKLEEYTVTFVANDGYMWDDGDQTNEISVTATEGDRLSDIYTPDVTFNNGTGFVGWTLQGDASGTVLDYDYELTGDVTLVAVSGTVHEVANLALDTEYNIKGSTGDITVISFTPAEEGYYHFESSGTSEGYPYIRYLRGDDTFYTAYDFDSKIHLDEGINYTIIIRDEYYRSYDFTVKYTKLNTYTVTFQTPDGYMYDNYDHVQELTRVAFEGDRFYNVSTPNAYSNSGAGFKGWALVDTPDTLIDSDYELQGSIVLVAVFGAAHNGGALSVDTEVSFSGEEKDVTVFTFTPEEDGYYRFTLSGEDSDSAYSRLTSENSSSSYYGTSFKQKFNKDTEYTITVRNDHNEAYSYAIKVTKLASYKVLFRVTDGYINYNGDKVQEVEREAVEGDTFSSVSKPNAYSNNGTGIRGWALETAPGTILNGDYEIAGNIVVVPVWGTYHNEGSIELKREYSISGDYGDVTAFTFVPSEDGYYNFYSYDVSAGDPFAELKEGDEPITSNDDYNDRNFSIRKFLAAGQEYTFIARELSTGEYNFKVKLEPMVTYKITFKVTDGYMYTDDGDEDERVQELTVTAFEEDTLSDIQPYAYSNGEVGHKGWKIAGDTSGAVLSGDYTFTASLTLEAVWGEAHDMGVMLLDQSYHVTGEKGDVSVFSFTPDEDGYYNFASSNVSGDDTYPYGIVKYKNDYLYREYDFNIRALLEKGKTYTFIAKDEYNGSYDYNVSVAKLETYTATFKVQDGYMKDGEYKVHEITKTVVEGQRFGEVSKPSVYSNSGARLIGWAVEGNGSTILDSSYTFHEAVVLVAVFGQCDDRGEIALDTKYNISGNKGDVTSFTFIPDETGYYKYSVTNDSHYDAFFELRHDGEIVDNGYYSNYSGRFIEGETYTIISGYDIGYNTYSYTIELKKVPTYTVTFNVEDGYMWDGNDKVHQYSTTVMDGFNLNNVYKPAVYSYSGARVKGWALQSEPDKVLENSYTFKGNTDLVPVWGNIKDKGEIALDTEYKVSGSKGDVAKFTFTPAEDGYYQFYSYECEGDYYFDPYGELRDADGNIIDSEGNFSFTDYLEAGKTYTYFAGEVNGSQTYGYSLKLTKLAAVSVTFKVTDGYMWDDDDERVTELTKDVFKGQRLYSVDPDVSSYGEVGFKGWALETEPDKVLERDYTIEESVNLVAVWGIIQELGAITPDQEYTVSGEQGDITTFTFVPAEDGYYRFYSYNAEDGYPYGVVKSDDDGTSKYGFSINRYYEKGKEYTLIAKEEDYDSYRYCVKLVPVEPYNLTLRVTDGHMVVDGEEVSEATVKAFEGEYLYELTLPDAISDTDVGVKGWALADQPDDVLNEDYQIEGDITLVAVWGEYNDKGAIELDKDYVVRGGRGDISAFTFTPEESGYYNFYSFNGEDSDPYGILKSDNVIIDKNDDDADGNNFRISHYLEKGKAYTFIAIGFSFKPYSYFVKLAKAEAYTIIFNVSDGYMLDDNDNVITVATETAISGQSLRDIGWYTPYSYSGAGFKGWALSTEPGVVLDTDYQFDSSVTLVPVWGEIHQMGNIELDKEISVSGDKGDISVFTFTPTESGDYKFHSTSLVKGEPYGVIKLGDEIICSDGDDEEFSVICTLQKGKEYTLTVRDWDGGSYRFNVELIKVSSLTVTFNIVNGYMYGDNDEVIHEFVSTAHDGDTLADIGVPRVWADNGAGLKGWALSTDPENVLPDTYLIEGSIVLVPVWGTVKNEGALQLGQEYTVRGEKGDVSSFTFTPEVSGWYKIWSYNNGSGENECDPIGRVLLNGKVVSEDDDRAGHSNFAIYAELEQGKEYQIIVCGYDYQTFNFTIQAVKAAEVTAYANGGYFADYSETGELIKLDKIVVQVTGASDINKPLNDDASLKFAGWATSGDAETPDISEDAVFTSDTSIYAVWMVEESKDLKYAVVSGVEDRTYNGSPQIQDKMTVKLGDQVLREGTDFTAAYSGNTNAGTASILLSGIGAYAGRKTVTFEILQASINGASVKLPEAEYVSDGTTAFTPEPTVVLDGKTLVQGVDYSVSYADNVNAGEAKVIISGKGNYSGTVTVTFTIKANEEPIVEPDLISISGAKVTGVKAKTWTGKALTQAVVVKLDGVKLVKGTDYKVTYSNNKNVGKATVKITGIGAYEGTITKTFKINPKGTTLKTPVAAKKALTIKWTKVTKKMSKSKITGYQIQLATNAKFTKNKKTVNVKGYSKTSVKVTKLKAKTKYYVRIRTYMKVGKTTYYSPWSAKKYKKTI